jgi:hypothetical protein
MANYTRPKLQSKAKLRMLLQALVDRRRGLYLLLKQPGMPIGMTSLAAVSEEDPNFDGFRVFEASGGRFVGDIMRHLRSRGELMGSPRAKPSTRSSAYFTDWPRLASLGIHRFAVCGLEAHICVHQSVQDLLDNGYSVRVPQDATDSRDPKNRDLAMAGMGKAGAISKNK